MASYNAQVWQLFIDQHNRPCWVNMKTGQATYQLQDEDGNPVQYYSTNFGAQPAPMGMTYAAPTGPARTIAFVGEKSKKDEWIELTTNDGKKYYHNPAKDETTWKKPDGFGKKNSDSKPPPPPPPPKEPKRPKYTTRRSGFLF